MTEKTEIKQIKNLFKSLIKDENSIFYTADRINKTLINKAKTSFYAKDKVFVKLYKEAENIEEIYSDKNDQPNLPLTTPFVQKKKDLDGSTLYSFKEPFELLHADITDLRSLSKSAVDQKCCLLIIDLFTSKIYTHPMKQRTLLEKSFGNFTTIF